MIRRIIEHSNGHPLKNQKILLPNELSCEACSQGKLIVRPSINKIMSELPVFLERIHGDICGPIHPPCGPFRYFMVLIDASTRWSHVCLLSTHNVAFARLLAQIIKLRAHFSDYQIKTIRLDNAGEFTSQTFNNFCMSIGIKVEHSVAHVHTQKGLAESLIKRLQLIARPLLMKTKLPTSTWGHAIMHAMSLIKFRPTSYHEYLSRPPIPVRPEWRIRIEVRGAILSILYIGTLIDLFFLRAVPVPIGAQTISLITKKKKSFVHTKELPPEWCPS